MSENTKYKWVGKNPKTYIKEPNLKSLKKSTSQQWKPGGRFLLITIKMLRARLKEATNLNVDGLYLNTGNAFNPLNHAADYK